MDNELLLLMAWAVTASIAALYYSSRANKLTTVLDMSMVALREIADGNAVITRTREGISIKAKDNDRPRDS